MPPEFLRRRGGGLQKRQATSSPSSTKPPVEEDETRTIDPQRSGPPSPDFPMSILVDQSIRTERDFLKRLNDKVKCFLQEERQLRRKGRKLLLKRKNFEAAKYLGSSSSDYDDDSANEDDLSPTIIDWNLVREAKLMDNVGVNDDNSILPREMTVKQFRELLEAVDALQLRRRDDAAHSLVVAV